MEIIRETMFNINTVSKSNSCPDRCPSVNHGLTVLKIDIKATTRFNAAAQIMNAERVLYSGVNPAGVYSAVRGFIYMPMIKSNKRIILIGMFEKIKSRSEAITIPTREKTNAPRLAIKPKFSFIFILWLVGVPGFSPRTNCYYKSKSSGARARTRTPVVELVSLVHYGAGLGLVVGQDGIEPSTPAL